MTCRIVSTYGAEGARWRWEWGTPAGLVLARYSREFGGYAHCVEDALRRGVLSRLVD
jgi:hypothetical protein